MSKGKRSQILLAIAFLILLTWFFVLSAILTSKETIQVIFEDVTQIQEGSTKLRYKGLALGTVSTIRSDNDDGSFTVTITLDTSNPSLTSDKAVYWLQQPEASNPNTERFIITETYIAVLPAKGSYKRKFIALPAAPIT